MSARSHPPRHTFAALAVAVALAATGLSGTATAAKPTAGKPGRAVGTVDFSCTLVPMDRDLDYTTTVSVAGKRSKKKAAVALSSQVGQLFAIAPLPVKGEMRTTLRLKVGGRSTTLTGRRAVDVAAGEPIPLPRLTGRVKLGPRATRVPVVVRGLTFAVASFGGSGESGTCAPVTGARLSTLTLK